MLYTYALRRVDICTGKSVYLLVTYSALATTRLLSWIFLGYDKAYAQGLETGILHQGLFCIH